MFLHYPLYYTIPMADDDFNVSEQCYRIENEADDIEDYANNMFLRVDSEYVQEVTSSNF